MQQDRLTEAVIKGLKPGAKREFHWEAGTGFGVCLAPDGKAAFVLAVSVRPEAAKPYSRRITIGPANGPKAKSLKDARLEADRIRIEAAGGRDPSKRLAKQMAVAKAERTTAEAMIAAVQAEETALRRMTISQLFVAWQAEHCLVNLTKRSAAEYANSFRAYVSGPLGSRAAVDVTRADVAAIHRSMKEAPYAANGMIRMLRALLNWAKIERGIDVPGGNPLIGFKLYEETPADRYLVPSEIKVFWDRLPSCEMSEPVRNGLRLALLLGQRGIELVSIRRQDVNLDAAIWTIPAAISKNGKAHLVPLPPMARQILAGTMATATPRIVKKAMQTDVPWLFPNPSRTDHIERHALSAALLDSQDKFGFILLGTEGSDPPVYNGFSPHDLRRTLASHVELLGHSTSVVGAILNHAGARKGTVTGRHYTVAELTALKRRALLDWEKAVREILAGRDPFAQSHEDRLAEEARVLGFSAPESNVVALKRPA